MALSTVIGTTNVSANASDDTGVTSVQFLLDGVNLGSAITAPPYTLAWDTGTAPEGARKLNAFAEDATGNQSVSADVWVTVTHADTTAPTVTVTEPAILSTVIGTTNVSANASDDTGVTSVQFLLDGVNLGGALTAPPYTLAWDTSTAPEGPRKLNAVAQDAAGNQSLSADVWVTVTHADTTAPAVTVTEPAMLSTVIGTTNVSANASDDTGVTSVQFLLDGVNLGAAFTAPPYTLAWDTSTAPEGVRKLNAVAEDATGNQSISADVWVTVASADVTAPLLSLTPFAPADGSIGVTAGTNLVTTFNENVAKGTGNIMIVETGVGTFEFIPVTSGQVSVSGAVVTINPSGTLDSGTAYHVLVDPTAITDTSGNSFVGISGSTTWNFATVGAGCVLSTTGWTNNAFTNQSTPFEVQYDAIPDGAIIDGLVGLSLGNATGYASLAATTRFNISGTIDARNDNIYSADALIPYVPGTSYHFRLVIDPVAKEYDIYVTPAGSGEIVLGTGYAFRTEQSTVSSLDTWAVTAGIGSQTVCNFALSPIVSSDTTPPSAPGNLTASLQSASAIALTWSASTDDVGVAFYSVERCLAAYCSAFVPVAAPTGTSYSDTGLVLNLSYRYRVRATDAAGNNSPYSPPVVATPVDTTPPTAPGNLTASLHSASAVDLTWSASTDDVAVTGYSVERCLGAACNSFVQIAAPKGFSYSDTGLVANTTYRYRVRATDASAHNSPYSSIVAVDPSDTSPPSAPSNLTASAQSSSLINLNWSASTDNVGVTLATDNVGVTLYVVERCVGTTCTGFVPNGALNGTSFSDPGLAASTVYQYRVQAVDAAGNVSAFSALVSATTTAAPGPVGGATANLSVGVSGLSLTTSGTSQSLSLGYAEVQGDPGFPTPAGTVIFGYRQNDILATETSIPATPLVESGRIYAQLNGTTDTGVAIVNPNAVPTQVSYYVTDENGWSVAGGSFVVPPATRMSRFLSEAPFNVQGPINGTVTFHATNPIAVLALRGFTNERSEFLVSSYPIVGLFPPVGESIWFPHFTVGAGWATELVLVNPTDRPLSGTVELISSTANVTIGAIGGGAAPFTYSIPPGSVSRLEIAPNGGPQSLTGLVTGAIRVTPSTNGETPSGLAIFRYEEAGITVTEASVPALRTGSAFRIYSESLGSLLAGEMTSIETGLAVVNPSASDTLVSFELLDLGGAPLGIQHSRVVGANSQIAMFLSEIGFNAVPDDFKGVLRISSNSPDGIAVLGLRGQLNERGDFLLTTLEPIDENSAPQGPLYFPHIVDSGGFTSQLILFNGQGQPMSGVLDLFIDSGAPISYTLQ